VAGPGDTDPAPVPTGPTAPGPGAPLPVVLDTDIGTNVDDALALALALRHPGLEVVAVTTVSGPVERRAMLAARLAALAGRPDVPVVAGAGDREGRARPGWVDGGLCARTDATPPAGVTTGAGPAVSGGAGGALQAGVTGAGATTAARLLAGVIGAGVAPVTLGPLTNLADALGIDPGIPRRARRLVISGGLVRPGTAGGRALRPDDDTNLATEPGAARRVLEAGFPVLLVPLEVTWGQVWTRRHLGALAAGDDLCRVLARMVAAYAPRLARRLAARSGPAAGDDGQWVAVLHDPLAVAALAEPGLLETTEVGLVVDHHDGVVTIGEMPAAAPGARPATIVTGVRGRPGTFADWLLALLRAR